MALRKLKVDVQTLCLLGLCFQKIMPEKYAISKSSYDAIFAPEFNLSFAYPKVIHVVYVLPIPTKNMWKIINVLLMSCLVIKHMHANPTTIHYTLRWTCSKQCRCPISSQHSNDFIFDSYGSTISVSIALTITLKKLKMSLIEGVKKFTVEFSGLLKWTNSQNKMIICSYGQTHELVKIKKF